MLTMIDLLALGLSLDKYKVYASSEIIPSLNLPYKWWVEKVLPALDRLTYLKEGLQFIELNCDWLLSFQQGWKRNLAYFNVTFRLIFVNGMDSLWYLANWFIKTLILPSSIGICSPNADAR